MNHNNNLYLDEKSNKLLLFNNDLILETLKNENILPIYQNQDEDKRII
jgi:hypothetical protein